MNSPTTTLQIRVGLIFFATYCSKFCSLSLWLKWGVFWDGVLFQVCRLKFYWGKKWENMREHLLNTCERTPRECVHNNTTTYKPLLYVTHCISFVPSLFVFHHHNPPCGRLPCLNSLDAVRWWAFADANPSTLLRWMSAGSILGPVLGTTLLFCTAMKQLLVL
jgi:hypothetical protein